MTKCSCGTPSEANFYIMAVIEDDRGETTYADGYYCDRHASRDMGRAALRTLLGLSAKTKFVERPTFSRLR